MNRKEFASFFIVFGLLFAGRIWIAGTGYLEDTDELLYLWIHLHFAGFAHPSTWVQCMIHMQGQPPEIFIRLFEYATILPLASATGKSPLNPDILYYVGLYNIVVSILTLYVFYRLLLKLQFSHALSLTGVVLLGTLFNFNMYTRHILPYEHAFLLQLTAFNLLLRNELNMRTIFVAGLLSAIGLTSYYGCFMFIFINAGYLVLSDIKNPATAFKKTTLFILPFILVLIFYEAFTRLYGASYIDFMRHYSSTVNTGGSYDEGLVYVFLYFYLVEKWWGLLLLFLFLAGGYLLVKNGPIKIKVTLLLGVVAYLTFGTYVFLFHKMVFEGRVLHIYYPFIIIGVLWLLKVQKVVSINYTLPLFVFFALLNYAFVIRDFNHIGYPRNAIYKYGLFENKRSVHFTYFNELPGPINYADRDLWCIDSTGIGKLPAGDYELGNLSFMVDVPDSDFKYWQPWIKSDEDTIVYEQLHFESHPAYTLEYDDRFGRQFYLEKKFRIRVVKINHTKN